VDAGPRNRLRHAGHRDLQNGKKQHNSWRITQAAASPGSVLCRLVTETTKVAKQSEMQRQLCWVPRGVDAGPGSRLWHTGHGFLHIAIQQRMCIQVQAAATPER
jgi:hypothetical protein